MFRRVFPTHGAKRKGQKDLALVLHAGLRVGDLLQGQVDLGIRGQRRFGDGIGRQGGKGIGGIVVGHEDHFIRHLADGPVVITLVVFGRRHRAIELVRPHGIQSSAQLCEESGERLLIR